MQENKTFNEFQKLKLRFDVWNIETKHINKNL